MAVWEQVKVVVVDDDGDGIFGGDGVKWLASLWV